MSTVTPSGVDTARLGKILGMMGSTHAGERATAAAMADRLVRENGLTWPQLLAAAPSRPTWREPASTEEAINIGLANQRVLSDWERGFLRSVNGAPRLSPKQHAVIDRIIEKIRAAFHAGHAPHP